MFTQLGEVLDETSQWLFQLPRTGSEVRPSVVMLTCDMVDQHMAQQCAAEPRTAIDLHSVITCYHVHCTPSAWRGENRIHLWVTTSSHEVRRKPDSSRVKACVGPKGTSASLRQLRTVCASVLRLFQHSSKLYKKLVFKQSCICSRQLVAVTHPLLACGPVLCGAKLLGPTSEMTYCGEINIYSCGRETQNIPQPKKSPSTKYIYRRRQYYL